MTTIQLKNGRVSSLNVTNPDIGVPQRSKHLKCDGQKPCRRCTGNNLECVYVASRRGYKGPRRKYTTDPATGCAISSKKVRQRSIASSSASSPSVASCDGGGSRPLMSSLNSSSSLIMADTPLTTIEGAYSLPGQEMGLVYDAAAPGVFAGDLSVSLSPQWANTMLGTYPPPAPSTTSYSTGSPLLVNSSQFLHVQQQPLPAPLPSHDQQHLSTGDHSYYDQCIDSFYTNFYPSHPIGPPRERLLSRAYKIGSAADLCPLMATIRWAGSRCFDPYSASSAALGESALQTIYSPGGAAVRDGHLVQAMIIAAVCLDGDFQRDAARAVCADAERLAVEVGMYSPEYAAVQGMGDPHLEESWRRTWRELYNVSNLVMGGADDGDDNNKPPVTAAAGGLMYEAVPADNALNVLSSYDEDSFSRGVGGPSHHHHAARRADLG